MNKKAFTLIELLAVIVILAIIALIAVPIIINIIGDSKYESQKRSVDGYAKAVEQAVADYQLKNNKKVEGKFITTDGKVLTKDDTILNVDYKGNVVCNRIIVNKDGSIYVSECTVDGDKVDYENGETTYGMIMERPANSNFFNTSIVSYRISHFEISTTLDIKNKESYQSSDCSYNQDESVICYWKETNNNAGFYDVVLASDGEMYTPINSTRLFSYLGYQSLQNDLDVSKLNTKYTTNMSYMFQYASACKYYNQKIELGDKFDTSNVTDMSWMFHGSELKCHGSFRFPDSFNTSNVTDMSHMFSEIYGYLDIFDLGNNFNTSNVTKMVGMFASSRYITKLNLGSKFDTSKVTNMANMFDDFGSWYMQSLDLGDKFDTSNVTDMSWMFYNMGRKNLKSFSLGENFNTEKVTNMRSMFDAMGFEKLEKFNLGNNFNTSNVIDMDCMFCYLGYQNLEKLDLGEHFNTSKVTNMHQMFSGTGFKKLKKLDLGKLFVAPERAYSNVSSIFNETGKESLEELYLWNFDYSKVWYKDNVFKDFGTDGVLTKVVVSNNEIKTKIEQLTSPNNVPQFWKDNDIIVVQTP